MATGENWTRDELDLTVAAYLKMLYLKQSGIPYNNTEFRRALLPRFPPRPWHPHVKILHAPPAFPAAPPCPTVEA